jgi:hypothetical protein
MAKKLIIAGMLLASVCSPALAETFNYACHLRDDYHLFAVKIDTTARTLIAKGRVFRNLVTNRDCAKTGWTATIKGGAAMFCAATQGVGDLTITSGTPGADGVDEYDCDLVRQ